MAFTPTKTDRLVLGGKLLWKGLITGTAGGETVVTVPLSRVDAIWVGNVSGESAGYDPVITVSAGNTLTYSVAPTSGATHWLFVLGID